jgi:predicted metal-dependent hydrolase
MATTRSSSTPPAPAGSGVQPALSSAAFEQAPTPVVRPQVEIRASTRRRKTAVAFYEGDKIVVVVPSRLRAADREETADRLVKRLLKRNSRASASDSALEARAAALSDRYLDGVRPQSIRWVANQNRRWGSCSPDTRTIRLSHRLQVVPDWVLDSVILHELAHLIEASHSPRFYLLVGGYPRLAEADAYLAGYSLGVTAGGWDVSSSSSESDSYALFGDCDLVGAMPEGPAC